MWNLYRKCLNYRVTQFVFRILELKHELKKLDASEHQFLNNGLINHLLTTYDAEMNEIPNKVERPEQIQSTIDEVIERANDRKRHIGKGVRDNNKNNHTIILI